MKFLKAFNNSAALVEDDGTEKIEEVNKRDEFIEHAKQEIISLQSEFKEE